MGILGVMFLILFTLKLLGMIAVSWWVVTAPLMLWPVIFLVVLVFGVLGVTIGHFGGRRKRGF